MLNHNNTDPNRRLEKDLYQRTIQHLHEASLLQGFDLLMEFTLPLNLSNLLTPIQLPSSTNALPPHIPQEVIDAISARCATLSTEEKEEITKFYYQQLFSIVPCVSREIVPYTPPVALFARQEAMLFLFFASYVYATAAEGLASLQRNSTDEKKGTQQNTKSSTSEPTQTNQDERYSQWNGQSIREVHERVEGGSGKKIHISFADPANNGDLTSIINKMADGFQAALEKRTTNLNFTFQVKVEGNTIIALKSSRLETGLSYSGATFAGKADEQTPNATTLRSPSLSSFSDID